MSIALRVFLNLISQIFKLSWKSCLLADFMHQPSHVVVISSTQCGLLVLVTKSLSLGSSFAKKAVITLTKLVKTDFI